jgi:CheY-like chemotaxis protein
MSGFEFMNEINTLPDGHTIPVILLTADEDMQELFYCDGVMGYFVKPVSTEELEQKIKECLA